MAKLSGYRKCVKWLKEASGFRKVSEWTSASSVENADGTTVENKLATVVANLASHLSASNPHKLTKSSVGLGNVDNTADSNKSVKYATSAGSATSATTATNAKNADNATYATTSGSADSVAWNNVSGKPSTYSPSNHNHDDIYYTETQINNMLSSYNKAKFSYDNSTETLTITN